jgi:hypothetical protein
MHQNRAKFQCCVVGYSELPISGDAPLRIQQVTVHDRQQSRDFL